MNNQITDAPISEIASGRKMNVLASDSRRTRSNRPAMTRPRKTLPPVATISSGDVVDYPNTWFHWGNEATFGMSFAERERGLLCFSDSLARTGSSAMAS